VSHAPHLGAPADTEPPISSTPTGPRAVVLRGGPPTSEEAAALAAALLTLAQEATASASGPAGWQRAALLEAVGARPFGQLADLATADLT
jgi:hypothetical protein